MNATHGTCRLCGKQMSRAGMSRHLEACAPRHTPDDTQYRVIRIRIQDANSPTYWMDVEIWAGQKLSVLDGFLRGIWCECCDHLSSFDRRLPRSQVSWDPFGGKSTDMAMSARLDNLVKKGAEFEYTYDFGSPTRLNLRVTGDRKGSTGDAKVRVLSRNDPPEIACKVCGAPATAIDVEDLWSGEDAGYCAEHQPETDFDPGIMPVVNSPRMGICGYTGPWPGSPYANL